MPCMVISLLQSKMTVQSMQFFGIAAIARASSAVTNPFIPYPFALPEKYRLTAAILPFSFLGRFLCRQQAGELLVALEQEFDPLCVAGEGGFAVADVHGAVEGLMGFDQCGRHGERVVEVGEGC